jgi:hypothetical protein
MLALSLDLLKSFRSALDKGFLFLFKLWKFSAALLGVSPVRWTKRPLFCQPAPSQFLFSVFVWVLMLTHFMLIH